MNLSHLALHNAVAEAHPVFKGWLLARYPANVRNLLNPSARLQGSDATMAEVRFVTAARDVRITVSSLDRDTQVRVYRGAFEHSTHSLAAGRAVEILLTKPAFFPAVEPKVLHAGGWSPDVWRVVFDNARAGIHAIDSHGHPLRPPQAGETPARRWLAYGSSITHASFYSYTGFAARELSADVANKGLSGACHVEPEAAAYLASLEWDFATLELGVNLRGLAEAEHYFEDRVRHMLAALRSTHPQQPIVLITVFTNRDRHMPPGDSEYARRQILFDDALERIHGDTDDANLHLVKGNEIVDAATLLGSDLLHPSAHGSARMGANLASRLRPILSAAGI